jgi:hypothetical protein
MMTRLIRSITLAVAVAILTVAPTAAGDQRPVHGQFTGSGVATEQRCGPESLTLGFVVSGVTTHLGKLTGSGTNCTEFTLGSEAVPIWDGMITLEAADGSTLIATYVGEQGQPVDGVATFLHTDTIVGGTGRFDGAAGEWTVGGTIDFTDLTVSGTVTGWLSY